jgi:predicted MFS family arabinose efflux permease
MPNGKSGSPAQKVEINSFRLLVAALLLHTIGPQTVLLLPGFVQGMVEHIGFTDQQAGYIVSTEMWGMTVSAIAMMFLVSRVNWRLMFRLSLGLLMVGNFLSAFVTDYSTFQVLRFFTGMGGGAIVALCYATFALTAKADRNFGLGIMFVLVYSAAVYPLLPLVFAHVGMSGLLLFFGIFAVVGLPFVRQMPTSGEEHIETDENAVNIGASRKMLALAAMFVYFVANFIVWTYIFRIGVAAGLSEQEVANGLSFSQFLGIAGAFTAAAVGARFGRGIPLSLGILGGAIPLIFLFGTTSAIWYAVIVSIYQFAWNMTHPYLLAAMASFDPSGKMVVYATAMQFIGVSVGPALGAIAITSDGYENTLLMGIALLVASLALILPPVFRQARLATRIRP